MILALVAGSARAADPAPTPTFRSALTAEEAAALAGRMAADSTGSSGERILDFASAVTVEPSGTVDVTETIRVVAAGDAIKRGIYRDFPTDYLDGSGNALRVDFTLVGVTRDGAPEPHREERIANGVRIYAGEEGVLVTPGVHTYAFTYRTAQQLGFFAEHDELYWNVTGNGWSFVIEHASVCVRLPPGVPPDAVTAEAYTGPAGARGAAYVVTRPPGCAAAIATTAPLPAAEGLTIVVGWPKGHVREPTAGERRRRFLADNRGLFVGAGGLVALVVYYLLAWRFVGRDPDSGPLVVQYEPPPDQSPASMRYVRRMGYDQKAFAATLLHLAVEKRVGLVQEPSSFAKSGTFVVSRTDAPPPTLADERALLDALVDRGGSVRLEGKSHTRVRRALGAHEAALAKAYDRTYFRRNRVWLLPGLALSVVIFAAAVVLGRRGGEPMAALFLGLWLTGWSAAVVALARQVVAAWRSAVSVVAVFHAIFATLFAAPFFAGEVFAVFVLGTVTTPATVALLGICLVVNLVFYRLMRAPTMHGRRFLDAIEGFREFLETVEKDPLHFRHPEGRTPAVFEKYLPYALALDVEQAWAEGFADVLAAAARDGEGYRPSFYAGHAFDARGLGASTAAFTSSLGSAIASSSTAPGSSSGSSGGGSSGGGGGGGGGGGW